MLMTVEDIESTRPKYPEELEEVDSLSAVEAW